ncbi:head-tail adaptor protein [Streptomyces sp. NPDC005820]|uniref:phage head completion protein n=1 Tax=Streptomyces sp. NPDC005820 TaxID=3157069 RepID=UPI0034003CE1
MPRHFTDFVEVYRAEIVADAYTKKRDWDAAVKVWAGSASVQPASTTEADSQERETTDIHITVFLPPTADVDSTDRLVVDGITYEVRSEPRIWRQGSLAHIYLRARRVRR